MNLFEYIEEKRVEKEITRLEVLILNERNNSKINAINLQISLCKTNPWRVYKLFCKKY